MEKEFFSVRTATSLFLTVYYIAPIPIIGRIMDSITIFFAVIPPLFLEIAIFTLPQAEAVSRSFVLWNITQVFQMSRKKFSASSPVSLHPLENLFSGEIIRKLRKRRLIFRKEGLQYLCLLVKAIDRKEIRKVKR